MSQREEHKAMKFSGWRGLAGLLIIVAFFFGCAVPPSAAQPPLSTTAVQATLDAWNPNYCKVAEIHGFYKPESGGATQVAYVSLVNPNDKVYAATFQLLTRPTGKQQWFLTSLVTHGSGFMTKRQGWDNLMVPVQEASSKQ
jgi:hypothetical protein